MYVCNLVSLSFGVERKQNVPVLENSAEKNIETKNEGVGEKIV